DPNCLHETVHACAARLRAIPATSYSPKTVKGGIMALFILGAGCTRGASFVDASRNPCLPPLDADFYAQLQRIRNRKHKGTITKVIQDTVELFGVNFQVSMESVFTTL